MAWSDGDGVRLSNEQHYGPHQLTTAPSLNSTPRYYMVALGSKTWMGATTRKDVMDPDE